jgi:hypothetical protein
MGAVSRSFEDVLTIFGQRQEGILLQHSFAFAIRIDDYAVAINYTHDLVSLGILEILEGGSGCFGAPAASENMGTIHPTTLISCQRRQKHPDIGHFLEASMTEER